MNQNYYTILYVSTSILIITILSFSTLYFYIKAKIEKITRKNIEGGIARIEVETKEEKFEIWLKKTNEEWPTIELWISKPLWTKPIEEIEEDILEDVEETLKTAEIYKNIELKKELKDVLNFHGATHPIDIKGANIITELKNLLEDVLLPSKI